MTLFSSEYLFAHSASVTNTSRSFYFKFVYPSCPTAFHKTSHPMAKMSIASILLVLTCGSSAQQSPPPAPLDGVASWLLADAVSPSSPPSSPPPPPLPPPTVSVRALFTLEGDAASFDVVQFKSNLRAALECEEGTICLHEQRGPVLGAAVAVSSVSSVSSGSIVVDVILVLRSRADATVASLTLHVTPPANISAEWFGGRVVLAGQPAVVITPGNNGYKDTAWMIDTQAANELIVGLRTPPPPPLWAFDWGSSGIAIGAVGVVIGAVGCVLWCCRRGPSHNNLRTREVGAITSPLGDSYQTSYAPPPRMSKPTSAMDARSAL